MVSSSLNWRALGYGACPRCDGTLVLFAHLDAYKCTCGFRITVYKLREYCAIIENTLLRNQDCIIGFNRGYELIGYTEESPF